MYITVAGIQAIIIGHAIVPKQGTLVVLNFMLTGSFNDTDMNWIYWLFRPEQNGVLADLD